MTSRQFSSCPSFLLFILRGERVYTLQGQEVKWWLMVNDEWWRNQAGALAKAAELDIEIAEHLFDYNHQALSRAQRRMQQHSKYSVPYFWAGFIMLDWRFYVESQIILCKIADFSCRNRRFFLQESQIFCTFGTPLPFVCSQTPGGFLADARLVLTQFSLRRYVRVVRDICGVFSVFFDARGYSAYDYSRPSRQRISV